MLHFCHLIDGWQVLLLTDHKTLCGVFHSLNPTKSSRQLQQLAILTELISDIEHVKDSQNIVADCLSWPTLAVQTDACDLPALAEAQVSNTEIQSFQELKRFTLTRDNLFVLCDTSISYPRLFVLSKLCKFIFNSIQSVSHPCIKSSIKMIKLDITDEIWIKSLKIFACQAYPANKQKSKKHTKSPIQTLEIPSARFHTVHIDRAGSLPPAKNLNDPYLSPYRYVFTCINCTSHWIEVQPISEISVCCMAEAFVNTWITWWSVLLQYNRLRGTIWKWTVCWITKNNWFL